MSETGYARQRFILLDGLRGVAAIMVATWHAAWIFPFATLAVDLFFALSGFVLAFAYGGRLGSWDERRRFIIQRLIRLEPLWLVGCALAILPGIGMAYFGWADWGWTMLAISIATAPFFVILPYFGVSIPLNPPGWSLTFELIANAVMLFTGVALVPVLAIIAVSAPLVIWSILLWDQPNTGFYSLLGCFPRVFFSFFLGVLIQRLWNEGRLPRISLHPLVLIAAVVLILGIDTAWRHLYVIVALFVLIPAVIWLAAFSDAQGRIAQLCRWLGDISYALYVIHSPIIMIAEGLLFLYRGAAVKGYEQTATTGWIVLPLSILAAHLLTRYFDRPVRRWLTERLLPEPEDLTPSPGQRIASLLSRLAPSSRGPAGP